MVPWAEVPAKAGEVYVTVLMDAEDAARLGKRRLSIGSHGYAQMWAPGMMLLHRWIMNVPTGVRHRVIVDHINRNRLDCRRSNLRLVTPAESNLNRHVAPRELPRGVYRTRAGRYAAKVKRQRCQYHLGTFDTAAEAAAVVEKALTAADAEAFQSPPAVPDLSAGAVGE